jgi:hypothetical protein
MLITFDFANHASFAPIPEGAHRISFVTTALKDHPSQTHKAEGFDRPLLSAVGLYGANASGKSNALDALVRMRRLVMDSFQHIRPTDPLPVNPFALGGGEAPSSFDVHFLCAGVRYRYGFEITRKQVVREWLHAWPNGVRQIWFERAGADKAAWRKGTHWTGEWSSIVAATRDNALLLSVAAGMSHPLAGPLYAWFARITAVGAQSVGMGDPAYANSPLFEEKNRPLIEHFLQAADLGICDYKVVNRRQDIVASFTRSAQRIANETEGPSLVEKVQACFDDHGDPRTLRFAHRGRAGKHYWMDWGEESDGTCVLINLLHHVLLALESGSVLITDELASQLHPLMVRELLSIFLSSEANPRGGQLLFSTHDTGLMDLLRRDALVRVEKDDDGSSTLAAFSDFRLGTRTDLEKVFLEGRVGGVPRLSSFVEALRPATAAPEAR